MIDKTTFTAGWRILEDRFGKQPTGAALDYLTFLSPLLTDAEFTAAARAVWASREFFPRPNDFLLIREGQDWARVQEAADLARQKLDWAPVFKAMTPPAQMAIKALGGIFVVAEQMNRNPAFVRKDFGSEYGVAATTIAAETALGSGALTEVAGPEVTPESRRIVEDVMKAPQGPE